MPDTTTYTRCMPANPKPTKILVYAWYIQRPFRFNGYIDCQKPGMCGAYILVQKLRIPTKVPNPGVHLAYTTIGKGEYMSGILEIPGKCQHGHLYFLAGVPVVYVIYLPYTSQCPICKNFPSVLTLGRSW